MIRTLIIAAALCGLVACKSGGAEGNPWYSEGDASYDSIKAADDACKAKGGTFQLKPQGDPTHLGDYGCLMPKGS